MSYVAPDRVECVILDWAGTVVDFGSFAPTRIFVEAFAEFGIDISIADARGPMGVGKWDHIRTLCNDPEVARQYRNRFGRLPTDDDVTAIYNRFMPLQIGKVGEYSELIPGTLEVIAGLRGRGIRIGSCSGYPGVVMEQVLALAGSRGLEADHVVASDDVPSGRPLPSQALANAIALQVRDVAACVKVDDTVPGIIEGRSAGMWTVALTMSGNALGLSYDEYVQLPDDRLKEQRRRIRAMFEPSGPHYLIDTIAGLPAVIADIERRMTDGERPLGARINTLFND